jgi:hypothetical protein
LFSVHLGFENRRDHDRDHRTRNPISGTKRIT